MFVGFCHTGTVPRKWINVREYGGVKEVQWQGRIPAIIITVSYRSGERYERRTTASVTHFGPYPDGQPIHPARVVVRYYLLPLLILVVMVLTVIRQGRVGHASELVTIDIQQLVAFQHLRYVI